MVARMKVATLGRHGGALIVGYSRPTNITAITSALDVIPVLLRAGLPSPLFSWERTLVIVRDALPVPFRVNRLGGRMAGWFIVEIAAEDLTAQRAAEALMHAALSAIGVSAPSERERILAFVAPASSASR